MCSSENCRVTDERTTTEKAVVNYDSSLPWELTTDSSATTSDPFMLFIHRYMDFSSILYIKDKHISIQQYMREHTKYLGNNHDIPVI
jgi:hypothetical protein